MKPIPKPGGLDPMAKPPDSLKATHKFYQRASADTLAKDPMIFDAQRDSENACHDNWRVLDRLQASDLLEIFASFDHYYLDEDCQEIRNVEIYGHQEFPGMSVDTQRQYDWTRKQYPDEKDPVFPADIATLTQGLFPQIQPEAAIVNLYSPGDTLSVHRDVSEASDAGLVSISLGCDGIFIAGIEDTNTQEIRHVVVRLHSGDVLYMSGHSRFVWHSVPQILADTCPPWLQNWPASASHPKDGTTSSIRFEAWRGWMANKRINLNIRQMRD
ncbi:MAG: hypothetical protein Q9222_001437 [Ikaeria aurantiellina]